MSEFLNFIFPQRYTRREEKLAALADPVLRERLTSQWRDFAASSELERRRAAADALSLFWNSTSDDDLVVRLLEDPSELIKTKACFALEEMDAVAIQRIAPSLHSLLGEQEEGVSVAAAFALFPKLEGDALTSKASPWIYDKTDRLRSVIAEVLSRSLDLEAQRLLRSMANDQSPQVRAYVARAWLAEFAQRDFFERLKSFLADEDYGVRMSAIHGLTAFLTQLEELLPAIQQCARSGYPPLRDPALLLESIFRAARKAAK